MYLNAWHPGDELERGAYDALLESLRALGSPSSSSSSIPRCSQLAPVAPPPEAGAAA